MFLIFVYRNPPKVSPGLILVQRPFSGWGGGGLYSGGGRLTFGGGGLLSGGGGIFGEKNCVSRKGSRTLNSEIGPDI